MTEFGVNSEVGKLRKVMVHRPDLSLQRLTPSSHDDAPLRRRAVGRASPTRTRPVRGADARPRRGGVPPARVAGRDAGGERTRAATVDRAGRLGVHRRSLLGRRGARAARRLPARRARQAPHRRPDRRRGGTRRGDAGRVVTDRRRARRPVDVRPAPASEHPVHPRLVVLDLRGRLGQPDVLAGSPPRGLQRGGDLQGPPDVRRCRLRVLVSARERGRPIGDRRLRPLVDGGRRRDADRQRRRAHRDE